MAKTSLGEFPPIVIDSREPEHTRYRFDGYQTVVKKLEAGDYSLLGYETEVACERKTAADAYGCVGAGRQRFERSLQRLAMVKRPGLLIESSLAAFCAPQAYSHIHASQAVGSFVSWCVRYRISGPLWVDSAAYGERVVLKFLTKFWEHREEIIGG